METPSTRLFRGANEWTFDRESPEADRRTAKHCFLARRIFPPTARLLAANCKSDPAVVCIVFWCSFCLRAVLTCPLALPLRPPSLSASDKLRGRHLITVELFINRGGLTKPELKRITDCPVKMLWASEDVAYSMESMREKKRDLDEGGLEVELITIKGAPHVGISLKEPARAA